MPLIPADGRFGLTDEDVAAVLEPVAVRRWNGHDAACPTPAITVVFRRWWHWWAWCRRRRTVAWIQREYAQVWQRPYPDVSRKTGGIYVQWRGDVYEIGKRMISRIYLRLLDAALAHLQPRSVLELGCGDGLITLALAARYPKITFTGLDVTWQGVAHAHRSSSGALPMLIAQFSGLPVVDPDAHRRVRWIQGSGAWLPFRARQFDLVISCLALEQMERLRPTVLRELRRVASRDVVMIEPFAEVNHTSFRRRYLRQANYWAGSLTDLQEAGFRVYGMSGDFPQKLSHHAACVWATT